MFDWKKLARDRCYLCGLDGAAPPNGNREHFISRVLFEGGKIPNPSPCEPLPSHVECNVSTGLDEERVAMAWAVCRPFGLGSQERWDRTLRGLKRPGAERLRSSFLAHIEPLPEGGAKMTVPHDGTSWVLAKMVKGIVYATSGIVLGPDLLWWVGMQTLDAFVETDGEVFEVPDVLYAKYDLRSDEPCVAMLLAIYGYHFFGVAAFPEGGRQDKVMPVEKIRMPWPRIHPARRPKP